MNTDQQVVGRATLPKSMAERYAACDAPPRLQDMNLYREDGKDALKFYTDPTYFFELWREEMNKEPKKKRKGVGSTLCLINHKIFVQFQSIMSLEGNEIILH